MLLRACKQPRKSCKRPQVIVPIRLNYMAKKRSCLCLSLFLNQSQSRVSVPRAASMHTPMRASSDIGAKMAAKEKLACNLADHLGKG